MVAAHLAIRAAGHSLFLIAIAFYRLKGWSEPASRSTPTIACATPKLGPSSR